MYTFSQEGAQFSPKRNVGKVRLTLKKAKSGRDGKREWDELEEVSVEFGEKRFRVGYDGASGRVECGGFSVV